MPFSRGRGGRGGWPPRKRPSPPPSTKSPRANPEMAARPSSSLRSTRLLFSPSPCSMTTKSDHSLPPCGSLRAGLPWPSGGSSSSSSECSTTPISQTEKSQNVWRPGGTRRGRPLRGWCRTPHFDHTRWWWWRWWGWWCRGRGGETRKRRTRARRGRRGNITIMMPRGYFGICRMVVCSLCDDTRHLV